jgi:ADP-ribose pyrophosphatase YjhB (NUDIX family)
LRVPLNCRIDPHEFAQRAGRVEGKMSSEDSDSPWMHWVRALQAISQTGLHYAQNPYDKQRYRDIGALAATMLARHTTLDVAQILTFQAAEFGYATPKVDVRGVVFRDDRILMVREIIDEGRWSVPGGWADVNETPSQAVVREVREESGYDTRSTRLLAVYDREKQGHEPPFPVHVYKLFFLCELIGGQPRPNEEASEIEFFARDALPELSVSRVNERQIQHFFDLRERPDAPTEFD